MSGFRSRIQAVVAVVFCTGVLVTASLPSTAADVELSSAATAAEHVAEAAKFENQAITLEAEAREYAGRAARAAARAGGGSKQSTSNRSISKRWDRLAKACRAEATEAREKAKSHREMAQGG